jgi:palmitoyl-protein thioesterase
MSLFLADINNERSTFQNATYATNLASLTTLVLVMFSDDKTVVPKESSWFGSEAVLETGSVGPFHYVKEQSQIPLRSISLIIPMRSQPLYLDDRIGLRQLDERGAVRFEICEGEHMQIGGCWERLLSAYSGGLLEGSLRS